MHNTTNHKHEASVKAHSPHQQHTTTSNGGTNAGHNQNSTGSWMGHIRFRSHWPFLGQKCPHGKQTWGQASNCDQATRWRHNKAHAYWEFRYSMATRPDDRVAHRTRTGAFIFDINAKVLWRRMQSVDRRGEMKSVFQRESSPNRWSRSKHITLEIANQPKVSHKHTAYPWPPGYHIVSKTSQQVWIT